MTLLVLMGVKLMLLVLPSVSVGWQAILADARYIVDAVVTAEDMTRGGDDILRGRVRIDVPASLGHRYVHPALPGFLARHPAIELHVILGNSASVFRPDGFNVLLRLRETAIRRAKVSCFGQTRFVHIARVTHSVECPRPDFDRGAPPLIIPRDDPVSKERSGSRYSPVPDSGASGRRR